MKKILISLALVLGLSGVSFALNSQEFDVPMSKQATMPADLTFVGASVKTGYVDSAKVSVDVSGRGILYDVLVASYSAVTDYLVCQDIATPSTNIASPGGTTLFMVFPGASDTGKVGQDGFGYKKSNSAGAAPLEFRNGLNCFTKPSATYRPLVTLIYRLVR